MKLPIVVKAELFELPKINEDDPGTETVVVLSAEEDGGHVILSQDALQAIHRRLDNQQEQIEQLTKTLRTVCIDTENPLP